MAVDHGLGGKDNQKSKDKRARRAKKQKAFARKAITGMSSQAFKLLAYFKRIVLI